MKRVFITACVAAIATVPLASAGASTHRAAHVASSVSGLDKEYLTSSMQGDLFEVQGGKLAERRSTDSYVLKLARTLVSDHTKSFNSSAALARRLGIQVPKTPTESQQWELKMVAALPSVTTFNHWYSSLEAYDHVEDISMSTGEIKEGSNAQVRADARMALPMLRKHLRLARTALAHNK